MRASSLFILLVLFAIISFVLWPWPEEKAWAVWPVVISLGALFVWLSFYVAFKVKLNKVLAEVGYILLVPLAIRSAKKAWKYLRPILKRERKREPRKKWNETGTVFDVLNLRLKPLEVVLGVNWGKPIRIILGKYHTMIGGSTGQGKTVMLNSMIAQLVLFTDRHPVDIWLFDLKSDREDGMFLWAPVVARYVNDIEDAAMALKELFDLREKRAEHMKLKPIVVIIDEFVDLTTDMPKEYRGLQRVVTALIRKARSAEMYFVAATQHPKYSAVPKDIAHNLLRKVALSVAEESQARVALGIEGKVPHIEYLDAPGKFILHEGKDFTVGRSILITPNDIHSVVERVLIGNERDIRLIILRRVTAALREGDTIQGINVTTESLRVDFPQLTAEFVKIAYRNFVVAGVFDLGGSSSQAGYRLAVDSLSAISFVKKYIEDGKWDEHITSPWKMHRVVDVTEDSTMQFVGGTQQVESDPIGELEGSKGKIMDLYLLER